eukprot:838975-Pleurochrysis_carterae.AAC.1
MRRRLSQRRVCLRWPTTSAPQWIRHALASVHPLHRAATQAALACCLSERRQTFAIRWARNYRYMGRDRGRLDRSLTPSCEQSCVRRSAKNPAWLR